MSILSPGVAHVSFKGGGMFLPVRTPYDRQTLIDHVSDRVRSKTHVQVLIDRRRWLVDRNLFAASECSACGRKLDTACYDPVDHDSVYCVHCVFGEPASSELPTTMRRRSA